MTIAIRADRLIDGTGGDPLLNPVVVLDGDRIRNVMPGDTFTPEANMDVRTVGGTVLPGFIEMHAHLMWPGDPARPELPTREQLEAQSFKSMRQALSSGVTTLRDLGAAKGIADAARAAQRAGTAAGPRLHIAGQAVTTSAGHGHTFGIEADTKEEVLTAIRSQAERGVDWIKIIASGGGTAGTDPFAPQYPTETLAAAVQEAEALGLKVGAHCHPTAAIRSCVEAGVRSLEHCSWLSADADQIWDPDDSVIEDIVARGLYVDPTHALIHLNERRGRKGPKKGTMRDPVGRYRILKHMWDKGVQFVTGIDSGIPNVRHDDFAWTPRLMVEAIGIPAMDAIVSSTRTSAECLGIADEVGTITSGKIADIIVVDGDPLTDISVLHEVTAVYQGGEIVAENGALVS